MFPNQNAIFERLELTKRFGLVSDYLVSWNGRSGGLTAKVTVWRNEATPDDVVQSYVVALLSGLVHSRRISVVVD
jgi:hypothetical protein